ncbi:hypothetical protein AKO1_005847 [Acrasis kona]|uniref:Uncharacterized protein n=1 Tax=Acrasis kona TaxID=1008807 RepID=A0AAW2YJM4_9EUKA
MLSNLLCATRCQTHKTRITAILARINEPIHRGYVLKRGTVVKEKPRLLSIKSIFGKNRTILNYHLPTLFPTNNGFFQADKSEHGMIKSAFDKRMRKNFFSVNIYATMNPQANTKAQVRVLASKDPLQQLYVMNTSSFNKVAMAGRPWDLVGSVYGFRTMTEALEFHYYLTQPQAIQIESLRRVLLKVLRKNFDDPTLATTVISEPVTERFHGTGFISLELRKKLLIMFHLLTHPDSMFSRSVESLKTPITGPIHVRLVSPVYGELCSQLKCPLHLLQIFNQTSSEERSSIPIKLEDIDTLYPPTPKHEVRSPEVLNSLRSTTQLQIAPLPPQIGEPAVLRLREAANLAQNRLDRERRSIRTDVGKKVESVQSSIASKQTLYHKKIEKKERRKAERDDIIQDTESRPTQKPKPKNK